MSREKTIAVLWRTALRESGKGRKRGDGE